MMKNMTPKPVFLVLIGILFSCGLVLGLTISPWWLLLMPAAIVLVRVIVGPI